MCLSELPPLESNMLTPLDVHDVMLKKRNYDRSRKFQEIWLAKLPWVELVVGEVS